MARADGTHSYQWDGEGRLVTVDNGATIVLAYNALGQQVGVTKGGTDVVWHLKSAADKSQGDYAPSYVGWNPAGVFFLGEKRVGFDVNGGMVFLHQNNLNSVTLPTTFDGSVFDDIQYYPWGQYWAGEGFVFAGMDHYWQDVLHNTPNRQYAFYEGRWLSPDPLGGDVTNPQSLNRYAYVLGNPTTLTDPSGLDWCDPNTLIYLGSNGYAGIGGGTCVDDATYNANPSAYQGYTSINAAAFASWYGAGTSFFLGWDPFDVAFYTTCREGYCTGHIDPVGASFAALLSTGPGGGCTDSRQQYIEAMRNKLSSALANDPECLTFLGARGGKALDTLANLPISLGYARGEGGRAVVADSAVYYVEGQLAPIPGDTVINRLGSFFASTPRDQATVLLHELGHQTGVLPPDNSVPRNAANTELIKQHCQKALGRFSN